MTLRTLIVVIVVCLQAVKIGAEPLTESQARFGVITGDAGLLSQGASDWIEPHEGLPIDIGDRIRTGEDGRVELLLSEHVLWVLEPGTEVVAERMEVNAGRINLDSGLLYGTLDSAKAVGRPQHWEINTPAAVMGIRGTEFAIETSKLGGTRLAVFEGEVAMQAAETAEGPQPPVDVAAGREAAAGRGKAIHISTRFSPRMRLLAVQRPAARRRQRQIENTWTPFTPTVRAGLRRRFVAPPSKKPPARHTPGRKRRRPMGSH